MKNIIQIIIALVVGGAAVLLLTGSPKLGGTSSLASYPCTTVTTTSSTIGNQSATTLLTASSRRAWARVSVPANATSTFYLSLGGTASVGNGIVLNGVSSTTNYMDVGLNASAPFTGAITGITNIGSTTAVISSCSY